MEARKQGVNGRAVIQCVVLLDGSLTNCEVIYETPLGFGFGTAALLMSQFFVMRPGMIDGVPTAGAPVRVPINFMLRPDEQAPPPSI